MFYVVEVVAEFFDGGVPAVGVAAKESPLFNMNCLGRLLICPI